MVILLSDLFLVVGEVSLWVIGNELDGWPQIFVGQQVVVDDRWRKAEYQHLQVIGIIEVFQGSAWENNHQISMGEGCSLLVVDGGGQSPLLTIGHDESVGDEEVDLLRGVGKIVIEDKFWLCLWVGRMSAVAVMLSLESVCCGVDMGSGMLKLIKG